MAQILAHVLDWGVGAVFLGAPIFESTGKRDGNFWQVTGRWFFRCVLCLIHFWLIHVVDLIDVYCFLFKGVFMLNHFLGGGLMPLMQETLVHSEG